MYLGTLSLGFSKYTDAELSEFTANVLNKMTDNPHFPTLQTNVTELKTEYDIFVNAIPSPETRNRLNIQQLKVIRERLTILLKSLGDLVSGVAKGNVEILLTSGYNLRKKPTSRPIPKTPTSIDVFGTNDEGVVLVACKKVTNATSYIARVSLDKVKWEWTNFENGTRVLVSGVPVNVPIFVQMQAKNPAGRSDWSNAVEAILRSKDQPLIKQVNISTSV